MVTRREFIDTLAVGAAGLAIGSTAKSYGQIRGSNDRLNFAVIGLNGRAYAHLSALKANKDAARIAYVCDVDSNILKKFAEATEKEMGEAPGYGQGLPPYPPEEGCGCDHDRHAGPLACSDGDCRSAGREACVCREALQSQPC